LPGGIDGPGGQKNSMGAAAPAPLLAALMHANLTIMLSSMLISCCETKCTLDKRLISDLGKSAHYFFESL